MAPASISSVNTGWNMSSSSSARDKVQAANGAFFVDRWPWRTSFMCPNAVLIDGCKCLLMSCCVSPGQERKWPLAMAFNNVDGLGLNKARWYQLANCSKFLAATMLCVVAVGSVTVAENAVPAGVVGGGRVLLPNGMSHMLVLAFLSPRTTGAMPLVLIAPAGYARRSAFVRTTCSPSLHSWPSDVRFVRRPGMTCALHASSETPLNGIVVPDRLISTSKKDTVAPVPASSSQERGVTASQRHSTALPLGTSPWLISMPYTVLVCILIQHAYMLEGARTSFSRPVLLRIIPMPNMLIIKIGIT